jgi:hypothetical protein
MGLYSNPNDRFRRSRLERVTNQDVRRFKSGRHNTQAAKQIIDEVEEAFADRSAKQAMREYIVAKPELDARTDRRRHTEHSTKAAFKLDRVLTKLGIIPASKLKTPAKKK